MRTDDECYTGTGPAAEVVGQVRQTKHILASEQRPRDGLPRFRSSSDGRTISDEDFIFDALLRVGGDFKTDSVRLAYAQWVCNALNDADKLLLGSPEVASLPQGRPTYTELLAQRDELAKALKPFAEYDLCAQGIHQRFAEHVLKARNTLSRIKGA